MASSVLFEVDASKIIAKLHLAGLQAAPLTRNEDFFVNTGIIDDDSKATPENPGKVSFDLTNNTYKYQLGYVTTLSYYKSYDVEKVMNQLVQVRSKLFGDGSKIDDNIDSKSKEYQEFETAANALIEIVQSRAGGSKNVSIDELKTDDGVKKLKDELAKCVKNEEEEYNELVQDAKDAISKNINAYMQVFAGKENVNQINEKSLGMIEISDQIKSSSDKGLVDNYEIQQISKQERDKLIAKAQALFKQATDGEIKMGNTFKNVTQKVCFYVEYTLNIDK